MSKKFNDKDYKIGSIVYVKDDKKMSIMPAIVAEKSLIQTLRGTDVTYRISYDGKTIHDLDESVSVFENVTSLEEHVAELVTTILGNMINDAKAKADELKKKIEQSSKMSEHITSKNNKNVKVIERDGKTVTIHMPDGSESE